MKLVQLNLDIPFSTDSLTSAFALEKFSLTESTKSLKLSLSELAMSELLFEILRRVSVPLSGAKRIPNTAPAAAPAANAIKIFDAFVKLYLVN